MSGVVCMTCKSLGPVEDDRYRTLAEAKAVIKTIDLSMVRLKLIDPEEGYGWSTEQVDEAELRYRRYLCMLFVRRNGSIVPTKDIDMFWHQHILDTRAYAADCERVFGGFIHHFPYFGMRGDEDAKDLQESFEKTKSLYLSLFGESYTGSGNVSRCHKCGGGPVSCHKCSNK